jgi:sigma-B regulation protein RsbU (phosphoserine phosphatase)
MVVAPLPHDEPSRLQALYALGLLDTPAEERFDSVARLAAEIFQVPMAFVSLIDRERQWMKSRVGLTVCQTSREISFCSHAILGEEALIIQDTHRDPRFVDNPLVTGEPHIRFYAGQPLRGPGGEKIGTLCIADQEPHDFTAHSAQVLRQLAALLERELQMGDVIEAQTALLKTQQRLQEELAAAARYVASLLPRPVAEPVAIDWRFLPSEELGGDCLGHHRLASGELAFYVLDVCGHGVGAAMLSVSLMNILRSQALPGVDFADPAAVLVALNQQFQMEQHGSKFFTMWYGVLDPGTGRLVYASGGHPPAISFARDGAVRRLDASGIALGCVSWAKYENVECSLGAGEVLYLFSDGAYEVRRRDGGMASLREFEELLARMNLQSGGTLDRIVAELKQLGGGGRFADDVSLLELRMPGGS